MPFAPSPSHRHFYRWYKPFRPFPNGWFMTWFSHILWISDRWRFFLVQALGVIFFDQVGAVGTDPASFGVRFWFKVIAPSSFLIFLGLLNCDLSCLFCLEQGFDFHGWFRRAPQSRKVSGIPGLLVATMGSGVPSVGRKIWRPVARHTEGQMQPVVPKGFARDTLWL